MVRATCPRNMSQVVRDDPPSLCIRMWNRSRLQHKSPRAPKKATSRDARPSPARSLPPESGEAHRGWSASGTTRAWVQQVQDQPTPGGVRAAPAQELAATAAADCAGPTTMHSWWQKELNSTNDAPSIILILS